jgi:hypothetical protein
VILYVPFNPDGLKVDPLTPVPLHVPPAVPVISVFKLILASLLQKSAGAVQAGFTSAITVILCDSVLVHPPELTV